MASKEGLYSDNYQLALLRITPTPHTPTSASCLQGEGSEAFGTAPPDCQTVLSARLSGCWTLSTTSPTSRPLPQDLNSAIMQLPPLHPPSLKYLDLKRDHSTNPWNWHKEGKTMNLETLLYCTQCTFLFLAPYWSVFALLFYSMIN